MKLDYLTRGGVSPQGKPRVYFTGHPDDFAPFFPEISADLFATQNCALYFDAEPEAPYDRESLFQELEQMQLFVIPVTSRFLFQPNRARDVEFPFAIERHIPVLPLMQEAGLEGAFNQVCGDLQMLNKRDPDRTALPYAQKLEKFLSSILVGDELAEKVRAAFDAYVFLSYRKKDRKYAQELMRLIHRNDFCRDIAIWYDEFLTPGEDFNAAIADALEKCHLFALAVTPSIVEPDNYVITTEYPEAKKAGKPILPVEMAPTSRLALWKYFRDLPKCASGHSRRALSKALLGALRSVAVRENDGDPEHNFFIGLAYLNGIDVEVDRERALALITGAAEAGLPEAMEKLADMYHSGTGVARDHYAAINWKTNLTNHWAEAILQEETPELLDKLFRSVLDLGMAYEEVDELAAARIMYQNLQNGCEPYYLDPETLDDGPLLWWIRVTYISSFLLLASIDEKQGQLESQQANCRQALELARKLWKEERIIQALGIISDACNRLGYLARALGQLDEAEHWFKEQAEADLEYCRQEPDVDARQYQASSWNALGGVYRAAGRFDLATDYLTRALEASQQRLAELRTPAAKRSVVVSHQDVGDLYREMGQPDRAEPHYLEMFELARQLYEETGTPDALYLLSISYERLAELEENRGQLEQAKEHLLKSLELDRMRFDNLPTIEARGALASSFIRLGDLCRQLGQLDEADGSFRKSLALRRELYEQTPTPDNKTALSNCYERLGDICREWGRLNEAKDHYMQSLALREELSQGSQVLDVMTGVALSCNKLGLTLEDLEEYDQARDYFRRAMEIIRRLYEETPTVDLRRRLGASCTKLGEFASARGQFDEAEQLLQEGYALRMALYEETRTPGSANDLAIVCLKLGGLCKRTRRFDEGRVYYRQALEQLTRLSEEIGTLQVLRNLASARNDFALFCVEAGDRDQAKTNYALSLDIAKTIYRRSGHPNDRNNVAMACSNLAGIETGPARTELLTQALEIWTELAEQCPEVPAYARRRDKAREEAGG